jgi:thiol-disulfide isomerase/thioredoxin
MNSSIPSVVLYYANWCPHCVSFKPEWNKIKATLDEKGITYQEYEESQNKEAIMKANIPGYPTIKINNQIYNGARDHDSIINAVTGMSGGGTSDLINELSGIFKVNNDQPYECERSMIGGSLVNEMETILGKQDGGSEHLEDYEQLDEDINYMYDDDDDDIDIDPMYEAGNKDIEIDEYDPNENYEVKYLKYKAKYLKLRSEQEAEV